MPSRKGPRKPLSISLKVQLGGSFWTKFERIFEIIPNNLVGVLSPPLRGAQSKMSRPMYLTPVLSHLCEPTLAKIFS